MVVDQEDYINQTTYTDRDERLRIDTDTKTREGDSPFAIDLLRELLDRLLGRKGSGQIHSLYSISTGLALEQHFL